MFAVHAEEIAGDSQRGEKLFTSERCIQCHNINGKGGNSEQYDHYECHKDSGNASFIT